VLFAGIVVGCFGNPVGYSFQIDRNTVELQGGATAVAVASSFGG
jgi:hypothetical protein